MNPGQQKSILTISMLAAFADGAQNDAERRFLAELKAVLGLDAARTATAEREGDALAEVPPVGSSAAGQHPIRR